MIILVSENINNKITFYTFVKILFLVAFSVFQILMLTSIFSNVKVLNKIEINNSEMTNKGYSKNFGESNVVL